MSQKNKIAKNIQELRAEIKEAQLVGVTKYSPVEDVILAYEAGLYDFGENRTSDLKEKAEVFKTQELNKVRWHFIGHLQTNKVRELLQIPRLWAIHSVDSLRLLEELYKRENEFKGSEIKVFLQINTSHEEEKSGFETIDELYPAVDLMLSRKDSKFKLHGLMTMGPIRTEDFEADARKCFKALAHVQKTLAERYHLNDLKLSMGMSQDYSIAMEEGSDYVRIGSKIFK